MAKRRLSHHQQRRIKQAQQAHNNTTENSHKGLVISHKGSLISVEQLSDASIHKCKIRSNLGAIICGDIVHFEHHKNDPVIVAIAERKNLIERIDGFGKIHHVAANISQLIIFMSVIPEPNLFLIDQYLASAEKNDIQPVIVLNKIDLLEPSQRKDPFNLKAIYQNLGYPLFHISVKNAKDIDLLSDQLKQQTNLISGVSGAGKSSLVKQLLPEHEHIKVSEISEFNQEGKHTTRTSTLYHLPCGGNLIDTPGIRGFNPIFHSKDDIKQGFKEIREAAIHCKFNNCEHIHEPNCAVREAVKNQEIAASRYEHYVKLLQNFDS